jgi:hypothetical protein
LTRVDALFLSTAEQRVRIRDGWCAMQDGEVGEGMARMGKGRREIVTRGRQEVRGEDEDY